jgi:hypothetical protein
MSFSPRDIEGDDLTETMDEFEFGYQFSGSMVIPTMQFGNLSPSFTVTGYSLHEARDLWLREAREIYRAVGKDFDLQLPENTAPLPPTAKKQVCVASGTEVMFDPVTHTYSPGKWLSGSVFAKQFQPDFPANVIAGRIAYKHGVPAADVLAWWANNSETATSYGSSIHAGVEAYGKYRELAAITKNDGDAALPKNPHVRDAVLKFFDLHGSAPALYEAFVADPVLKHCGFIDRLVETGNKTYVVDDIKTNHDIRKSCTIKAPFAGKVENTTLGAYWLQLSFYARILASHGRVVDGLTISHWDGCEWTVFEHDVVDVSEAFSDGG